jgi:hypothetical protein
MQPRLLWEWNGALARPRSWKTLQKYSWRCPGKNPATLRCSSISFVNIYRLPRNSRVAIRCVHTFVRARLREFAGNACKPACMCAGACATSARVRRALRAPLQGFRVVCTRWSRTPRRGPPRRGLRGGIITPASSWPDLASRNLHDDSRCITPSPRPFFRDSGAGRSAHLLPRPSCALADASFTHVNHKCRSFGMSLCFARTTPAQKNTTLPLQAGAKLNRSFFPRGAAAPPGPSAEEIHKKWRFT